MTNKQHENIDINNEERRPVTQKADSSAEEPSKYPFKLSSTSAGLIAGSIGGIAGVISGHPFDTVKVSHLGNKLNLVITHRGKGSITKPESHSSHLSWYFTLRNDNYPQRIGISLFNNRTHRSYGNVLTGMGTPLVSVALVNSLLFGVYEGLIVAQTGASNAPPTLSNIFLAGVGSGLVNSLISSPMELVKIQLQNQGADLKTTFAPKGLSMKPQHSLDKSSSQISSSSSSSPNLHSPTNYQVQRNLTISAAPSRQFRGPIDCFIRLYQHSGIRGIYRGFPVTLIREGPSYGVYFVSYEVLCRSLATESESPRELAGWRLMLCAGLAGIAGWSSTYPFDVAKTVIQADPNLLSPNRTTSRPPKLWDCLATLYRENGIRALFRGLNATIIRAFPTNVAILSTWQLCMNYFRRSGLIDEPAYSST